MDKEWILIFHPVYPVNDYWIRIGSAWAHTDGNGFNIQLETMPLDGRIALRVASEKAK